MQLVDVALPAAFNPAALTDMLICRTETRIISLQVVLTILLNLSW
jgi:hypothetical protein